MIEHPSSHGDATLVLPTLVSRFPTNFSMNQDETKVVTIQAETANNHIGSENTIVKTAHDLCHPIPQQQQNPSLKPNNPRVHSVCLGI